MSQVSIVDIEGNNPQIPTRFNANVGFAIPIANVLEILATTVAAGSNPARTIGSGNTIETQIQLSQAITVSDANAVGLAAFDDNYFSVDANGFVSLIGGVGVASFNVDAATAPGTDPVLPIAGVVTVTGAQVAAGTTANVIRTHSTVAGSYTIEIQRSSAQNVSTVGANGVSHFNDDFFTVDSNGFVSIAGGAIGQTITGNSGGALSPVAGNWNIFAAAVAAGTTPAATAGAGNTLTVNIQRSQAIASTNAANVGLAAFDSAKFTVDGNGFVSVSGTGVGQTITGNTGGALSPTAGNWNIVTSNSTIRFEGAGSTNTWNASPASMNLAIGSSLPAITSGTFNTSFGQNASAAMTSGSGNVTVGYLAGGALTQGTSNTLVGTQAGAMMTLPNANVAIGANALANLVGSASSQYNVAIGTDALSGLNGVAAASNIAIGRQAGSAYNGNESSNIMLGNAGVVGESNVMRLGGSSQTSVFLAGIAASPGLSNSAPIMRNSSNQISSAGQGTVGQVFTSNGSGTTPSWQAPAATVLITTYSASGSWSINSKTKTVRFLAWGGGGGGGSGRCGATGAAGGGGGGAAGGFYDMVFNAADLTGSPYTVTIGAGGTGGTSVNAVTTNGNPGNPGTNTTVGSFLLAAGSAGGAGGTTGSAAGGTPSYMTISGITTQIATGSAGNSIAAAAGTNFQNSYATGGGGGSGYASATPRIGGAAGSIVDQALNVLVAGGAAGANTGATAGNGNSPVAQSLSIGGTGGGGGGHNGVTTAGTGGNGAFPGGGGGGGAGQLNSNPSGAGGNGANGYLVVIEYF